MTVMSSVYLDAPAHRLLTVARDAMPCVPRDDRMDDLSSSPKRGAGQKAMQMPSFIDERREQALATSCKLHTELQHHAVQEKSQ